MAVAATQRAIANLEALVIKAARREPSGFQEVNMEAAQDANIEAAGREPSGFQDANIEAAGRKHSGLFGWRTSFRLSIDSGHRTACAVPL
ncbi:hypothetical protein N9L06_03490 [Mariniblastus sp.]|nr:hypothetical protein [Mariniblastus sp.]